MVMSSQAMVELKNKYPFPGSEGLCRAKPHFAATCWAILSRNRKVNLYCVKALFWMFLPKQIQLYMIKGVWWPLRIMEMKQNWRVSKPRVWGELHGASATQTHSSYTHHTCWRRTLLLKSASKLWVHISPSDNLSSSRKKDGCFLRRESALQFTGGKMETQRVQAICSPSLIYLIIRREPSQAGSIVHS